MFLVTAAAMPSTSGDPHIHQRGKAWCGHFREQHLLMENIALSLKLELEPEGSNGKLGDCLAIPNWLSATEH